MAGRLIGTLCDAAAFVGLSNRPPKQIDLS
jgi:hypothetical protein